MTPDAEMHIEAVRGDCLELLVEIEPGTATEFGVKVRRSPGGTEETAISCLPGRGILKIDFSKSTLDDTVKYPRFARHCEPAGINDSERHANSQEAPFELAAGEPLRLHIFLDRSVLEVFANGRECLTQRIYPTRADSLGMCVFASGGRSILKSLDVWDMLPVNSW